MNLAFTLMAVAAGLADEPKPALPLVPKAAPAAEKKIVPGIPLLVRGAGMPIADRPGEVKQAYDQYQALCVRYVDSLARAKTPEAKEALSKRPPTPTSLAMRLGVLVAANPKDDAAFDALALLVGYANVPAVAAVLDNLPPSKPGGKPFGKLDPTAVLLEHHLNNPKLGTVLDKLADGPEAKAFMTAVFEKSVSQQARGTAGYRLVATAREADDDATAEKLLVNLADDRYMDGAKVPFGGGTIKDWAERELREIRLLAVGKPIPEIRVPGLDGKSRSVADHKGKVVVLDVWTTWCGPCKAMIPHQREMVKKLEGKPFALVSVSCDEELNTVKEFLQDTEMPWEHWWAGKQGDFSKAMNIRFYPTIYVIDAKGVIRHKNIRGEKLDAAVEALLKEVE